MSQGSHLVFRSGLDTLPGYLPGRTIPGTVKLASNEVPGGPLPSVASAIAEATSNVNRYPDMGAWALVERIASEAGVSPDQVAIGCGSVALCQQLIQALCEPGDHVVFPWRSFEAYPIITQIAGAWPVKVPLDSAHNQDLDAVAEAITPQTKLIFLCNPNNPTGTAIHKDALAAFLDRIPERVIVALDEAYREFVTDTQVPDGVEFVRERPNVVVVRTFSKAYGLAGLRVGYSIASPEITTVLRKVYLPFSVNALAQTAAIASLDAGEELRQRRQEIIAERTRVRDALLDFGYKIPEAQGNFVWLPLGERAMEFAEHTLAGKVVVRPFADGPTGGVRVTIGTHEENNMLLDAARSFEL
jgi:histidinol-phosphate aminotransferase